MAKSKALPAGVGAVGKAKARFFSPSQLIQEKLGDRYRREVITDVLVIGKGKARISKREQDAYQVRIPSIDENTIFNLVCCHLSVTTAPATPFPDELSTPPPTAEPVVDRAATENAQPSVNTNFHNRDSLAADIARLRSEGVEVDDEDVAPENITTTPQTCAGKWEKPRTCPRRSDVNVSNQSGNWKAKAWSHIARMDEFSCFRMCMPEQFIRDTIIPATNKKILGDPLTLSEFYKWLGIRFYMACFVGVTPINLWWSTKDVDRYEGAPFRLNDIMSLNRFRNIDSAMCYTDIPSPTEYTDKFHQVRQMLDAFNDHMEESYSPSWLNCLDESMNSWLDKNCPGFMVVPRKPHPFGNEYHTIVDGDKGAPIMWRVKLQEGKDRPKKSDGTWAFPSEFESHTKTVKLMLEMTKPIHGTGKIVSMDSGFCVSAGILAMHDKGVYGQALIKKRGRYWPKGVPGDDIDLYFATKELGDADCYVQELDGKKFLIHCHKEDPYVCKVMSTHGLTEHTTKETWRKVGSEWRSFTYTEAITNHNNSKHWVDDVNNRRHAPIGLEDIWATKWWPHRQFTFVCSVAEVNANNSLARANDTTAEHQIVFRKRLAKGMIENTLTSSGGVRHSPIRARKRKSDCNEPGHVLLKKPNYTGKYNPTTKQWATVKTQHLKMKCHGCSREIRTYCACNKASPMCSECFATHYLAVSNAS